MSGRRKIDEVAIRGLHADRRMDLFYDWGPEPVLVVTVRAYGPAAEIISNAVDEILSMQEEELPAPTTDNGVVS